MSDIYNGYSKPIFFVTQGSEIMIYEMSFKYQALREYIAEERTLVDKDLSGRIIKKTLWIRYGWELDYSQHIEPEDSRKIKEVINALYRGQTVRLQPHKDVLLRSYEVIMEDGKKGLQVEGKGDGARNYGLILKMLQADTLQEVDWKHTQDKLRISLDNLTQK